MSHNDIIPNSKYNGMLNNGSDDDEEEDYFLLNDMVDNDMNIFSEKKDGGGGIHSSLDSFSDSVSSGTIAQRERDDELFDFKKGNISFHIRNLTISTGDEEEKEGKKKEINRNGSKSILLDDISLDIPESCICGIIGGSGSGKTTLLNYLMNTYNSNDSSWKIPGMSSMMKKKKKKYSLKTKGEYYIKTKETKDTNNNEIRIAYLQQYDFLPEDLTPVEILTYTADLKLMNFSKQKKLEIVEMLLLELGLKDCKNIKISNAASQSNSSGDSSKSKSTLSGGEKRRLGIAIQMISNPKILFLDEPTTGLDSYSAILLLNTLRKLCKLYGTTFILSIHQPRADIFSKYLDQLIILSSGKLLYCDKADKMIEYFTEQCNTPLPVNFLNPCDYYIDMCSIDNRSAQLFEKTYTNLIELENFWKSYRSLHDVDDASNGRILENVKFVNPHVNYWTQIKVQFKRNIVLDLRDYWTLIGVYMEPVVIGCVTGWIFFKPVKSLSHNPNDKPPSNAEIRSLTSSLYSISALQGYLFLLFETYRLCSTDIKLYDMERLKTNRIVTPFTFLVSRKLSKLLLEDIIVPFIITIITYFMYGLNVSHGNHNSTAANFFIYFSFALINHQLSTNLALISVAISREFPQASLVANLSYTLQSMANGFFVNSKDMPVYVRWTKYIAFLWATFGGLASNHFSDSSIPAYREFLKSLGFPLNWVTVPIIISLAWAIGFWIIALIIFNLKTFDFNQTNSTNIKFQSKTTGEGKEDLETGKKGAENDVLVVEKNPLNSEDNELDTSGLDIELKDLSLQYKDKYILDHVSAYFEKNKLNVIMGPSGSGKSTLLNVIANRFGLSSAYTLDGCILLDNEKIEPRELNKHCSYVKQHEDHLLSRLTVWETLYYAGRLRLPDLTDGEIRTKVEQMILDLGIWHCKDVLIGDEFNKGISGGEKKRVSIGVQLLANPEIVLLDEPTSGLDSFTASTMMDLLGEISKTTTVIATIHQPRSEIFQKFGNVLLLSKYGKVAFNGSPLLMNQFFTESLNFKCPRLTNIADFYLDLISLNSQNDINEKISQVRVTSIIEHWEAFRVDHPFVSEGTSGKDIVKRGKAVKTAPLYVIYEICVIRQFKNLIRNMDTLLAKLLQVPGMGIVLALYFSPLKHSGYSAILNRFGLVQEVTAVYFVGMLTNLAVYPGERNFFYNEFQDGVHGGSLVPFFYSYMTLELPLSALSSIIYAIFLVLIPGLPRNATNFFWTFYGSFILVTCGESLGIITNTLFNKPGFVVTLISMVISLGSTMSGVMSLSLDKVLQVINWFSPMNFVIMTLINSAFPESLHLKVDPNTVMNGKEILLNYGLYKKQNLYMLYATLVMIGYRMIAYAVLWWKLKSLR